MRLRYDGERFRELADLRVGETDYRTLPQGWMG